LLFKLTTGKMRKTTARKTKKKASLNIKENQEERFTSMECTDHHYSGNNCFHEKEKKSKSSFK
jgi:hypothetical protein